MTKLLASGRMYRRSIIAVASIMFSACTYACPGLVFTNAWVREPPPVAKVAAAYLSITNETDRDILIDHFESDCCGHIMAHETIVEDAKTKMKHLSKLAVPARQTIKLEPLGKHLMLMKPLHGLSDGDKFKVRFHCGSQGSSEVIMPIVKR